MKVEQNRRVGVSYVLTVEGEERDRANSDHPLTFVFGHGQLLPAFEEALEGLEPEQEFEITLEPEDGYGVYDQRNIVELPITHFTNEEGKVIDGLLEIGNTIPMSTVSGATLVGRVKELSDDKVIMDFNHELAGKKLHFKGRVEKVDEVSEQELEDLYASQHGGCGCGCGDEEHQHGGGGCGDGCCDGCC